MALENTLIIWVSSQFLAEPTVAKKSTHGSKEVEWVGILFSVKVSFVLIEFNKEFLLMVGFLSECCLLI